MAQAFRTRRGAPKVTLALAEGAPTAITVAELMLGFGGDPLVLNDAGSVAAFELLAGLWRDGLLARESLVAKYDTQVDHLVSETAWLAQNWPFTSGVLARQDLLDRFEVYEGWRGPARAAHVVGGDVLGHPARRLGAPPRAGRPAGRSTSCRATPRSASWRGTRGPRSGRTPTAACRRRSARRSRRCAARWRTGGTGPGVAYWPAVSDAMNEAVRRIVQRGEPVRPVLDRLHAGHRGGREAGGRALSAAALSRRRLARLRRLPGGVAAVDDEDRAGHVARGVARQVDGEGSQVLRAAELSDRDLRAETRPRRPD